MSDKRTKGLAVHMLRNTTLGGSYVSVFKKLIAANVLPALRQTEVTGNFLLKNKEEEQGTNGSCKIMGLCSLS